jgi:hypothetical protein
MTAKASILRTLLAGLSGGAMLNIVMVLTFRLLGFGWDGGGILINHSTQSPKLIAIWTELEPIPLVVASPAPIIIGLILFGIGHAFIYRWLSPAWPQGIMARTLRMGMLVFFLSFLFWEFFTPFNLFGEPLPLIGLELLFWATIAFAEAFVMSSVFEWKQTK